ncbi:MAG TPA: YdeI/OmpD-associated family protein [Verrucomicrobiae bacterium]|jgi:hypothetical protein|nr:YdeI/OmpD-associated family protein [Verrucomicrobiae bacterium]
MVLAVGFAPAVATVSMSYLALPFFIFKTRLHFGTLRFAVGPKMKIKPQDTEPTIRFSAELLRPETTKKIGTWSLLTLPKSASAKLPSRGVTMIEGTINGFPFRAALEPTGKGSHWLRVNKPMQDAAGADAGDTVMVEITRAGEEPEIRVPMDLRKALATAPRARAFWSEITPMARRDWVLWISSAKQTETRRSRIDKACDMLSSGKRRVCCFGGLNWLRKDHAAAGETWLPLPDSKKRFSPRSTK